MTSGEQTRKPSTNMGNILRMIIIGALGGIIVTFAAAGNYSISGVVWGIAVGLWITILCIYGNTMLLSKVRHLRFIYFLLLRTIYYSTVFVVVISGFALFRYLDDGKIIITAHRAIIILIGSFGVSLVISFGNMLRRMLGGDALLNFITGKYHKPVHEKRFIMFLDIASSTTIAEKIGDVNFHVFLNDFFYDISTAIVESQGEIYKYVGDEVIVSWKYHPGSSNAGCTHCFFAIRDAIVVRGNYYRQKFGFVPQFRAGIHFGTLVIGEMGDLKMEIAFLGDTVNTTARLQEACKTHNKDLIVSGEALAQINLPTGFEATKLGETQLRGKETKSTLYSIEKKAAAEI
jgi:adenylate cyclase